MPEKEASLKKLEEQAADPDIWNDQDRAQQILKERANLTDEIQQFSELQSAVNDVEAMLELVLESKDDELALEFNSELVTVDDRLRKAEMARMLSGQHDKDDAILEINSGAGGTEAQDWGEMLLRMYTRWAEVKSFKTELLDASYGEEAGIKSATLLVQGKNAFGLLRSERGVHRLVRISPFDANARRHTSFASVSVTPDVEEEVDIEIKDEEVRIDTYRASGAGGQHVNKTDSAVRITHLPSSIVVSCQSFRSQHKNKDRCFKVLKAKLYEIEMAKKREEVAKLAGEQMKIDFGSQIRNYVMQPYQLVKDLRTGTEVGDVQSVLDGELDSFIEAYLLSPEHNIA